MVPRSVQKFSSSVCGLVKIFAKSEKVEHCGSIGGFDSTDVVDRIDGIDKADESVKMIRCTLQRPSSVHQQRFMVLDCICF